MQLNILNDKLRQANGTLVKCYGQNKDNFTSKG